MLEPGQGLAGEQGFNELTRTPWSKTDGDKRDGGRNGARSMTPSRGQGPLTPRTRALGKGTAPTAMAEGTPAGRRTALRREVPAGWAKPEAGGDGVHEPRGS